MIQKVSLLRISAIFLIAVLILTSSFSASQNVKRYISNLFSVGSETVEKIDITSCQPEHDAFHGTTPYPSIEWWYFDCMFNQNYSAHIGFKVFTYQGFNLLKPSINIYRDTKLIANETTFLFPFEFTVSEQIPEIKIGNEPVMKFDKSIYDQSGKWQYHVRYSFKGVGVNLTFFGESKGWVYHTNHEGWTVAIPQGKVEGQIYVNDEIITVNGRGYHDHNWNFSLQTPVKGWSWYWGKITGDTLNFAWAIIKDTGVGKQTFADRLGVLNTQHDEFFVIDPQNITFHAESFIFRNNRFIPTSFYISAEQDNVSMKVSIKTEGIHRSDPTTFTLHYWRYFVSVTGFISYKENVEYLDEKLQIMEYMRFV